MGNFFDIPKDSIGNIPDSKPTGFSIQPGQLWKNSEFRLDMRGVTADGKFNLQIQANKQAKATSVRKVAPATVAGPVVIGQDEQVSTQEMRNRFLAKIVRV